MPSAAAPDAVSSRSSDRAAQKKPPLKGPALVAAGAAGWGTEGLWRSRLTQLVAPYPIVFLEHLLQVLWTLPWLLKNFWLLRRGAVPRRALVWVLLSGGLGSSLGTVCFTAAYATDVNKTAAAVLLNLQPVVSTIAAALLFGERIRKRFYPWAALAVVAGIAMAVEHPTEGASFLSGLTASPGFAYVAATIVLWGFATVAGRGAMRDLPLGLAAPLRLWAGLLTTGTVIGLRVLAGKEGLSLAPLADWHVWLYLVLLTTVSGALPLFVYFAGLARTPAAIAGYCEMFYTVTASAIAWVFLDGKLAAHQVAAAVVLVAAIVMLNRADTVVGEERM